MPELRPTQQQPHNAITNEVKSRLSADSLADGFISGFGDLIQASSPDSRTEDLRQDKIIPKDKAAAKYADRNDRVMDAETSRAAPIRSKTTKKIQKESAEESSTVKDIPADLYKNAASLKEGHPADDTAVVLEEKSNLEALEKLAQFLLSDQQQLPALPPELKIKLQDFLANLQDNNPASVTATDALEMMQELTATFKTLIVNMQKPSNQKDALTWPKEIIAELQKLGVNNGVKEDKAVTLFDSLRILKNLVNAVRQDAQKAIHTSQEDIEKTLSEASPETIKLGLVSTLTEPQTSPVTPIEDKALQLAGSVQTASEKPAVKTSFPQNMVTEKALSPDETADMLPGSDSTILSEEQDAPSKEKDILPFAGIQKAEGKIALDPKEFKALQNPQPIVVTGIDTVTKTETAATTMSESFSVSLNASAAREIAANNQIGGMAAKPQHANAVTQQVVVQIQRQANSAKDTQIAIQLTPEELGKVDITITINKDGKTHAAITVDRPETLALLQKDSVHLEKALQNAGLNANGENMQFNLREQRQGFGGQKSKRLIRDDVDSTAITTVSPSISGPQGALMSDGLINYHA